MYIITRDGFALLMMKFSGPRAAKFREQFISEFNRMEAILHQGETPVLIPTYQKRLLSEPTKGVPDGYWSIFDKSHAIMFFVEKHIGSVNEFDLVDGSIGARWSKYRDCQPWAVECKKYPHEYNDVRGSRDCKCYQLSELQYFDAWLNKVYKMKYLYEYLHGKYKKEKNIVMLDKVETILPKLLPKSA